MKANKSIILLLIVTIIIAIVSACALNPKLTVPPDVLSVKPEESCTNLARADAWDTRVRLIETEDTDYLVVYFNPPFDVQHEPTVRLKTGPGIYQGREGKLYFYRLGKTFNSIKIGYLRYANKQRGDDRRTFLMERREGTDCVMLLPVDNPTMAFHQRL